MKLIENKRRNLVGRTINACLFLISDISKKITGTNLIVDGGYSSK